MAQPDFDFFINRAVLLGPQPGDVDPVLTPAANTFQFLDGKSTTQYDKIDRKIDAPYFNSAKTAIANERVQIEGDFELTPPATPGAALTSSASCETLLLSAGMKVTKDAVGKTTIYTPISRNIPAACAYWYHSGTLVKAIGARSNIQGLSLAIDERFKGHGIILGAYDTVDEAAAPAGLDYSLFPEPTICNAENTTMILATADGTTIAGLHLWAKNLSVDFGNQQKLKQYTEYRKTGITTKASTFQMLVARPAKADADLWALRKAGTLMTFVFRRTEADGRWSELRTRGQLLDITPTDTDGDYTLQVTGQCVASSAGGDEFGVAFGDAP